jgi:hypothetical protein
MKKDRKKWLRIEILIAVGILLILLTLMFPRFLNAQRRARAAQLQKFIEAVMPLLAENDAAIVREIEEGKKWIKVFERSPFSTGTGYALHGQAPIYTYENVYFVYKSALQKFFQDQSLPYLSNDLLYGEPVFFITLNYLEINGRLELVFFGMHSELYDDRNSYQGPEKNRYNPGVSITINSDNCYQPEFHSTMRLYNPSNGLSSGGIVYRNSYEAGWRVKASTEPVVEQLKSERYNRYIIIKK